jgi:hypothetical protein
MISVSKQRVDELRALAAQILHIADDLERDNGATGATDLSRRSYLLGWDGENAEVAIMKAAEYYRARRRRKRFFAPQLFGEPAWDLLLDLFIARLNRKRVSVSSACYAADVPSTTALRWLGILSDHNLIERFDSETDQRVTWVRLTDYGADLMNRFFADVAKNRREQIIALDQYLIVEGGEAAP